MANCVKCQVETKLHANGIPLCPSCSQTTFEDWKTEYAEGCRYDLSDQKRPRQASDSG